MKNLLTILFFLFSISVFGQYRYFANIAQNQVYDNASFTGNNCGPRLQASFKNFRIPINSYNYGHLSYDQPLKLKNGDYIGIGGRLAMLNTELFDNRSGSVLASYNKQISGNNEVKHFLSLGVGITIAQEIISQDDLRWPSQIDSIGFNPDLPGEDFNNHLTYPGIELGISYSLVKNKNKYVRTGIGIKDINQPNVAFGTNPRLLHSTMIISAMGSTIVLDDFYWQPEFRFQNTQTITNISFVSNFKFIVDDKSNGIIVGAGYTNLKQYNWNTEIFNLNIGTELGQLTAMFSYDFNLNSDLSPIFNPSLEFGLGYRFCD